MGSVAPFQPSTADLAHRDVALREGRWFRKSRLLRAVSAEYLADLAQANSATNNAGMKAIFDAEFLRRDFAAARSTDRVLIACALLSLIAIIVAIFS